MAVNPLSTPLKTEYKPLGLEAFAQPLSDMQAKFDTVKQEIEAADFALSRLSQDDPRAKDLLKEIEGKRDQLAENLMSTGNYRQASSKLLELNKVYNKDEETNAIKGNYESYQKAAKEHKERVAKGDITQKDYDLWDFRVKHSFQGTQYDKANDTYSSINVHPKMKNMEKELREESLKLAGMAEEQVVEEMQRRGINAFTTETITNMRTHRDRDQVAREIEQFLRTSDQYKNWVQEDADDKWYYNTNTDPEFKEKYISSVLNQYDARINAYSEYLKNPQQAATAQKEIERLKADKANLLGLAEQSMAEGTFDNFSKSVFMDQAEGRFKSTAFGASDIVDMEKLTMTVAEHTDDAAKGKADEALKKLGEVGSIATNIAANAGEANTTIISGTATSSRDKNAALANYHKDAYSMMKNTTTDSVPDLKDKSLKVSVSPDEEKTFKQTLDNSKDLFVTIGRMNNFNAEIKNRDEEISLKKEELAKAKSLEEKKQITAELNTMYQDKEELKLALTDDTKTFDNILDTEINKSYITPELKKLYETEYKNDPVKFLRTLREHSNNFLQTQSNVGAAEETVKLEFKRTQQIKDAMAEAERRNVTLTEEDILKQFPIVIPKLAVTQDDYTMLANNVMQAYKWNLSSKFDAIGSEIVMNKNLNVMTDGSVDEIIQYVKENTRGKSDAKKVSYNILTGESTKDPSGNQYDLEGCYNPTPHFAGVDKNGDVILRYVLKSDFDPETKTAKTAVANYIKTAKGLPDTDLSTPADSEIAAFRKANPTDLYIAVEGRTKNLVENAEKNYVDFVEAGLAYNDGEVITQSLHNYAPVHVNSNAERKENYYKMAARLVDAQRNDHKFTEIIQAPAAWKDNNDGTFSAFQITYKVKDGAVIAQVNQGFMGADKKVTWSALTSKTLDETGNNMPNALAAMDLVYGTGREEDLVNTQRGFNTTIFVPAFENPGIALQGPTGFLGK